MITTIQITNHAQLMRRIDELNATKNAQEYELKNSFRNAIATIDLISMFKGTPHQEIGLHKMPQTGLHMALNLITDLVLGKHRSIQGYISSVLVEKLISVVMNNNLTGIISTISSLVKRKSQFEKSREFNQ